MRGLWLVLVFMSVVLFAQFAQAAPQPVAIEPATLAQVPAEAAVTDAEPEGPLGIIERIRERRKLWKTLNGMVRDVRRGTLTFEDGKGIELEFLARHTGVEPAAGDGPEVMMASINPDNLEMILEFLAEYVVPIIMMLLGL